jgi:hypothetical protein
MDSSLCSIRTRTWASPKLELRRNGDDAGVFTRAPVEAGEILMALAHVFAVRQERHTIQLEEHLHQAGTGEIDDFLNHSCAPSTRLDFERLHLVALRPLVAGEELTFNYLTSEWTMAAPFACRCGAAGCLGRIAGFSRLAPAEQEALRPWVSPFLRRRLDAGRRAG